MPRYVEPKSELAFRNAKTGPKPYLVREGTDPVEQRRADVAAQKRAADGAFHLVAKAWLEFKRKEWADEICDQLPNVC
jgi:hypothetical protein